MEKIMEIPGGRGSNAKPSGTENPVGWGVKLEKTLRGGEYGYFLEPHIVKLCYIGKSPEWAYVIFLMFQKEIPQLGNVHKLANKKIIIYLYY